MSSNDPTAPISPARFAAALRELPLSSVALKAAEIRNSIAHLEYSNLQLQPFAHPESGQGESDPDCIEAIQENEVVIVRMKERIELLKVEVERRGVNWREFAGPDEIEIQDKPEVNGRLAEDEDMIDQEATRARVNGTSSAQQGRHSAWTDGTFQMGRIRDGEIVMDGAGNGTTASAHEGGRLGDEELRMRMEERMGAAMQEDSDEGMHL